MKRTDRELVSSAGTLFTRHWQPEDARRDEATLVLFHDSLGSVELWRDFPERLAATTRRPVLAYDRIGFGRSSAAVRKPAFDFMAEEARSAIPALLRAYAIESFVGFGHSVGGAMAVFTAAAFPDACVGVITESAQAFVEDRTTAGIREAMVQFAAPEQVARLAKYHGDKARWVLDAWFDTWLSAEFAEWTLEETLRAVRCPLLALHGDRDEYGSRAHPERTVANAAGRASMHVLDDCGHVPHKEKPEEVLTHVARFLDGLRRIPRG